MQPITGRKRDSAVRAGSSYDVFRLASRRSQGRRIIATYLAVMVAPFRRKYVGDIAIQSTDRKRHIHELNAWDNIAKTREKDRVLISSRSIKHIIADEPH